MGIQKKILLARISAGRNRSLDQRMAKRQRKQSALLLMTVKGG
jgi:hypothetical protein